MSWGNPQSRSEKALVKLLWPASFGMGTASYARMVAYSTGLLKQQAVKAEVISVGNITCGGTGKTPVTIDLARRLVAGGRKVAVLSRGYKRQSKEKLVVVSDGQQIIAGCRDAGDEPYLIASSVPRAAVIVGAKRVDTAGLAVQRLGCDTILLDDGFQHVGIARDMDIVLIDYNDELENDHLMPAGRLREPLSGLARADWIVITKVPNNPDLDKLGRIRELVSKYAPNAKVTSCRMVARSLNPFGCPDVELGGGTLKDTKIFAFAGIARPEAFFQQLREMGANIVGTKTFGDHHWYSNEDTATINKLAEEAGAEMVITTEKDSVKLMPGSGKNMPLAVLQQSVEWLGPVPMPVTMKQPAGQRI